MTNPTHYPLPAGDPQWVTQAVNAIEAFGPWPKSNPATVRALLSMWGNRIMLTSAQADAVVAEVTGLPVTDADDEALGRALAAHAAHADRALKAMEAKAREVTGLPVTEPDQPCSRCGAPAGWGGRIDPEHCPFHPVTAGVA